MDLLTFEKFLVDPAEIDFYTDHDNDEFDMEDTTLEMMEFEDFSTHLD